MKSRCPGLVPHGFLSASLLLVTACGHDVGKGPGAVTAGTFALSDGIELVVEADGTVMLLDGERETWASPPGGPFFLRDLTLSHEMALGMWQFTRSDERDHGVALQGVVPEPGDVVRLEYLADDGTEVVLRVASASGVTRLIFDTGAVLPDALVFRSACSTEGSFHGWGAQYSSVDRTGDAFPLFLSEQGIGRDGSSWSFSGDENTTYFPMPWYVDVRGFGVLVESPVLTNVDLCASDPAVATMEVVQPLAHPEVRVVHGNTPLQVVSRLGEVVGRPKQPPSWSIEGAWMCAQGGVDAVTELVDRIEASGVVATTLWVQDWTGRRENPGGGYGVQYRWAADEDELYPGIAAFFEGLHDRGYKVVGYVNPFVDPALQHWDEMEAAGMLPTDPSTGETYTFLGPRGNMTTADLSNEDTREYIREHLRVAVNEVGLDGWMADFAEWMPLDAELAAEDDIAVHNRYPELWQSITREVMDELRPDGDWLMYARSGYTGVHRVAMVHWIGDQEADWLPTDGLPTVVPAMLSLSISGQPYVTHDIAGFSGGPSTEELYKRWTELGALTPFMRTHDGNERDANWRWDTDADTIAHFAAMTRLHAALAPELIDLAEAAATTGHPIVRHLMLAHPEDPETHALDDQYLLGTDLLVAPVLEEGQTERTLYLPAGSWTHVWTGEAHDGPGWVTVDAPIGEPPLFSLDGDRPELRAAVAGPAR